MTHLIPEIVRLPCDFLKQNFYFIIVLNFQNIVKIVQRVPVCLTTSSPIINILHSVQFSCSVMSDSLRSHESRHARSPCPSPTPGVHSNSRPSSPWCHPAISSWVVPFSSCPQSSTPFPIWNQSVVPCPVLTVASWPAYRFLKRQIRWSGIPISFRIFHSLLWSTQSKALA